MSTTMTVRLDDDLKERLEGLAEATQRTKSFLAAEAIREYLDLNEWQVRETQAALAEADASDFATDDEVDVVTTTWTADAG
jgi:predicted transcriptional regulator